MLKNINADYICMATRGAGALKKIIGTTASNLISTSPIPVIIVPKNYRFKPIAKIAYASDLENFHTEITEVKKTAALFKCHMSVYHFSYKLHYSESKRKIEALKEAYKEEPFTFHLPSEKTEYPLERNLDKMLKKEKPSILIMFSKQRKNWLDRFFGESMTAEMTFDLKVPLLAFRKESF